MPPAVIAGIAIAGAAIGAIGAIRQGQAAQAAAEFNAKVAENNASSAKLQAKEEERRHRIVARKRIGATRAAIGASGISLEGSPLDVLEENAANAELDALTIRHAGEVANIDFLNRARVERFKGRQAKTNSFFNAGSTLLLGGASALSGLSSGGKLPSGAGA